MVLLWTCSQPERLFQGHRPSFIPVVCIDFKDSLSVSNIHSHSFTACLLFCSSCSPVFFHLSWPRWALMHATSKLWSCVKLAALHELQKCCIIFILIQMKFWASSALSNQNIPTREISLNLKFESQPFYLGFSLLWPCIKYSHNINPAPAPGSWGFQMFCVHTSFILDV